MSALTTLSIEWTEGDREEAVILVSTGERPPQMVTVSLSQDPDLRAEDYALALRLAYLIEADAEGELCDAHGVPL